MNQPSIAWRPRFTTLCFVAIATVASGCSVECPAGTEAVGGACLSPDDLRDGGARSDGGLDAKVRDGEVVDGCDGLVCDGTCVDIQTDPQNCGGCGEICNAICDQGTCGGVVQVAAGGAHTCVLHKDGTVSCWGHNLFGQVGDGSTMDRHRPVRIPNLNGVVELAAGGSHTCARLETGTVQCWGANSKGQVNQEPSDEPMTTPTTVPRLGGVTAITAGGGHSCALKENGRIECWGANDYGQLGYTDASNHSWSTYVGDVEEISAGMYYTCYRSPDKTGGCWGMDGIRELAEQEFQDIVALSFGMIHVCVRYSDGRAACFGDNSDGQLCTGHYGARTEMSPDRPILSDFSDVTQIIAGMWQTCFLASDGSLHCCGRHGATPDPNNEDLWSVTRIDLDDAVEISAKGLHTCARRATGEVLCWGDNEYGQLGDGSTYARETPTPIAW